MIETRNTRVDAVDAMRAFALFGILVVNIVSFASAYIPSGMTDPALNSWADTAAIFLIDVGFLAKFYLLFSFLFGYSFTLRHASAQVSGAPFVAATLRRQFGLALIGILHGACLFYGDILTAYALLGLIPLLVKNWSDKALRRTFWSILAVLAVLYLFLFVLFIAVAVFGGEAGEKVLTESAQEAALTTAAFLSSPASAWMQNLSSWPEALTSVLMVQAPFMLVASLLGMIAARRDVFGMAGQHGPLFRRLIVLGALIGLPGSIAYGFLTIGASSFGYLIAGIAIMALTSPFLAAAYFVIVLRFFDTHRGRAVVDLIAPAGRMALTNYLMQSVICAFLFHAYGFGLMGSVPMPAVLVIACIIFAVEVAWSRWWMARYAYGPVEWLLRLLTHAKIPDWRRRPLPAA